MRRLKSGDPERQEIWRYSPGRDFSIVDLTIAPEDGTTVSDYMDSHYTSLMLEHYGKYHFEAAEMIGGRDAKGGPEIEIIGRFESYKDAKEYCEAYADGNVTKIK